MKIVLINPTPPGLIAFGVRSLGASCREAGHQVKIVFPSGSLRRLVSRGAFAYHYTDPVLEHIVAHCEGSDLIGLSFCTHYFDRALKLTQTIKENTETPVIWGGIHASTKPEEALSHVDFVCIGEGERSLLTSHNRIADGDDVASVPGIWFKDGNAVIKTPLEPLIPDPDILPCYDFSNHFVLARGRYQLEPLTVELLGKPLPLLPTKDGGLKRAYRTMSRLGCVHLCTY